MRFLAVLLSALLIAVLASPGSARTPRSDLECQVHKGMCFPHGCPAQWSRIGSCSVRKHRCCRRCERRPKGHDDISHAMATGVQEKHKTARTPAKDLGPSKARHRIHNQQIRDRRQSQLLFTNLLVSFCSQ